MRVRTKKKHAVPSPTSTKQMNSSNPNITLNDYNNSNSKRLSSFKFRDCRLEGAIRRIPSEITDCKHKAINSNSQPEIGTTHTTPLHRITGINKRRGNTYKLKRRTHGKPTLKQMITSQLDRWNLPRAAHGALPRPDNNLPSKLRNLRSIRNP